MSSDVVTDLIAEMSIRGWAPEHQDQSLVFHRENSTITGHQEYVTYQFCGMSISSELASRYWTSKERLEFLLNEIRNFANQDDMNLGLVTQNALDAWLDNADKEQLLTVVRDCRQTLGVIGRMSNEKEIREFCSSKIQQLEIGTTGEEGKR